MEIKAPVMQITSWVDHTHKRIIFTLMDVGQEDPEVLDCEVYITGDIAWAGTHFQKSLIDHGVF